MAGTRSDTRPAPEKRWVNMASASFGGTAFPIWVNLDSVSPTGVNLASKVWIRAHSRHDSLRGVSSFLRFGLASVCSYWSEKSQRCFHPSARLDTVRDITGLDRKSTRL